MSNRATIFVVILALLVVAGIIIIGNPSVTSILGISPRTPSGSKPDVSRSIPSAMPEGIKASPSAGDLPPVLGPNASTKEREAFNAALNKLAKEQNTMTIGKKCALSPVVVTVKKDNIQLTVTNGDSIRHNMRIFDEVEIPPGAERAISTKFKTGPGTYGLVCDSVLSGYVMVSDR